MRTIAVARLYILILAMTVASRAAATTVDATYYFSDFTTHPLNVRRVTITPLAAGADYAGAQLSAKPLIYNAPAFSTLTNGTLTASNLITGYAYRVAFSDGYSEPTITNYFGTNLSGAVDANTYKTTLITYFNGVIVQVYYSYLANTNFSEIWSNIVTDLVISLAGGPTNGVTFAESTNIAAYQALLVSNGLVDLIATAAVNPNVITNNEARNITLNGPSNYFTGDLRIVNDLFVDGTVYGGFVGDGGGLDNIPLDGVLGLSTSLDWLSNNIVGGIGDVTSAGLLSGFYPISAVALTGTASVDTTGNALTATTARFTPSGSLIAGTNAPTLYGPVIVTSPYGGQSILLNGNSGNYLNGFGGTFNLGATDFTFWANGDNPVNIDLNGLRVNQTKNWYLTGNASRLSAMRPANDFAAIRFPTPPLGFNSWQLGLTNGGDGSIFCTYAVYTNAVTQWYANGLIAAGWKWFCLDSGWQQATRDASGYIKVNSNRWPAGYISMTNFTWMCKTSNAYAGMYTSFGTNDCVGLAGTPRNYVDQDVTHWANMGFTHLKVDSCAPTQTGSENGDFGRELVFRFGNAVNNLVAGQITQPRATNGTPMFLLMTLIRSAYDNYGRIGYGAVPPDVASIANAWEEASYFTFSSNVVDHIPHLTQFLQEQWAVRPGHYDEYSSTFPSTWLDTNGCKLFLSIHAILSSPIYSSGIGYDSLTNARLNLMTNAAFLSIHQDPGVFGATLVTSNATDYIIRKPLGYGHTTNGAALAIFNRWATNITTTISTTALGFAGTPSYTMKDVWAGTNATKSGSFTYIVQSNTVALLRLDLIASSGSGDSGAITNNETRDVNLLGTSNYISGDVKVDGNVTMANDLIGLSSIIGNFYGDPAGITNLDVKGLKGAAVNTPNTNGVSGQILKSAGNGGVYWDDEGTGTGDVTTSQLNNASNVLWNANIATNNLLVTRIGNATNDLNTALGTKRTNATNDLNTALVNRITQATNAANLATSLSGVSGWINTNNVDSTFFDWVESQSGVGSGDGIPTLNGKGTNTTLYFTSANWGTNNTIGAGAFGSAILSGNGSSMGTSTTSATIAGGASNYINSSSANSFVGGGLWNSAGTAAAVLGGQGNQAGSGSEIVGGLSNTLVGSYSLIGSGTGNRIKTTSGESYASSIVGGVNNTNFAAYSFTGGGLGNYLGSTNEFSSAASSYSSILGGSYNFIGSSYNSAILGGQSNKVVGDYSVAAGRNSKTTNSGSFIFTDSQAGQYYTTSNNQFVLRFANGVGINTNNPGTNALKAVGTIAADYFVGDGSQLTGITGSGTVTHTGGNLDASYLVLGNGAADTTISNIYYAGNILFIGQSGDSDGKIILHNTSAEQYTISPPPGGSGSHENMLPATTGQLLNQDATNAANLAINFAGVDFIAKSFTVTNGFFTGGTNWLFTRTDGNGMLTNTFDASPLTNLTYQLITTNNNIGLIYLNKATRTNLTGNITIAGFAGVDANFWQTAVLVTSNATASAAFVKFPTTCLATNCANVDATGQYATNLPASQSIFSIGVGFNTTNVSVVSMRR